MAKVLITTVPFGKNNRFPLDLLENAGIEYLVNPLAEKDLEKVNNIIWHIINEIFFRE